MSKAGFEGKWVVVTGGSSGVGLAVAHRFAAEGARLVLCARDPERLEAASAAVAEFGNGVVSRSLDVSDAEAVTAFARWLADQSPVVDVLVNAAFAEIGGTVAGTTVQRWHDNFGATVHGAFYMMHALIPALRKSGTGAIVNISSVASIVANRGTAAYAAAKSALEQLTRVVAVEEAANKVRANAILLGGVDTPALRKALPGGFDGFEAMIPLGRVARAEEVAEVVRFLASQDAAYITAALLVVDGGLTATMGSGADQSAFRSS